MKLKEKRNFLPPQPPVIFHAPFHESQLFFRTALSNIIFIMITFARYSVMLGCWKANPKNRPTFEELSDELRQMRTTVTVSIKSFKI